MLHSGTAAARAVVNFKNGGTMGTLAGMYLVGILFLIVLTICWLILPFAILGSKPLLRILLVEARRTNELLERLAKPRACREPFDYVEPSDKNLNCYSYRIG